MKKIRVVLIVVGIIALAAIAIAGPIIYSTYSDYKAWMQCPSFAVDPADDVKACAVTLQNLPEDKKDNIDRDIAAHVIIWLHLAHVHAGDNDQQEFERNSAPYLNKVWPSPVIALYLGKANAEEVYAKSKDNDPATSAQTPAEQACQANFYVGEWFLQKNMKEEARKAFHAADGTCTSDDAEWESLKYELKMLGT